MDAIVALTQKIQRLERQIHKLQTTGFQKPIWLAAPLTSASWNGDSFSTTAKTLIDLSAVFSAPAGIKAIVALLHIRDSASASGGGDYKIVLSPNNTADSGPAARCGGLVNDLWHSEVLTVPCDANGDVYYQIAASGANTFEVYLEIWAYWL